METDDSGSFSTEEEPGQDTAAKAQKKRTRKQDETSDSESGSDTDFSESGKVKDIHRL